MQVKIAGDPPATAFNVTALQQRRSRTRPTAAASSRTASTRSSSGRPPTTRAYGTTFAASGDCTNPNGTNKCDGIARINQQGGDLFTVRQPRRARTRSSRSRSSRRRIHDEMNSAAFDEFGRMTANLGLEAVPATPAGQNILLYPYIAPPTEVIDATNLPKGDVNVQPISDRRPTGPRSGRSPTTASTPTRSTSTCTTCRS